MYSVLDIIDAVQFLCIVLRLVILQGTDPYIISADLKQGIYFNFHVDLQLHVYFGLSGKLILSALVVSWTSWSSCLLWLCQLSWSSCLFWLSFMSTLVVSWAGLYVHFICQLSWSSTDWVLHRLTEPVDSNACTVWIMLTFCLSVWSEEGNTVMGNRNKTCFDCRYQFSLYVFIFSMLINSDRITVSGEMEQWKFCLDSPSPPPPPLPPRETSLPLQSCFCSHDWSQHFPKS